MNDPKPINIMGVVAFPDPDPEKQVIRFIDSRYNDLFTIPNGGNIILTRFDGSEAILPCTYIDDCHAKIGREVYHICEFAEIMEKNGGIYRPEHPQPGDICDHYEIYQLRELRSTDYAFRPYEEARGRLRFADYQRAYAGVLAPSVRLEELWNKHNQDGRPFGRQMRSMSVSDVVALYRGGRCHSYYVDDIGFQELERFLPRPRSRTKPQRRNEDKER
ncbi:MAG: YodL domain-containing protein [Syntrophomonadaceae bacterium]|nr:YodL domain-containing protein [Syntrophomonadaceae bacterium]